MGESSMQSIDTSGLMSQVGQVGPLFAFMLLVIIVLCFVVRTLYNRNIALGDKLQEAFAGSTLAMDRTASSNNAIARQMEIMNAK